MAEQSLDLPPTGRGMGRGLAAILSKGSAVTEGLRELPVELVRPNPHQPRRSFDSESLLALAESIKARGVLQPVVVRPLAGGHYELVAGERRLRAARLAELSTILAVVRETDEAERLELALIENMAREDLNPVEQARACATLVEDLGVTKEELGRRVGRSRVAVSNLIRLLDLPEDALGLIEAGQLARGPRPGDPHLQGPHRASAPGTPRRGGGVVGAGDGATSAGGRGAHDVPAAERPGRAPPRSCRGAGHGRGRPDRRAGPDRPRPLVPGGLPRRVRPRATGRGGGARRAPAAPASGLSTADPSQIGRFGRRSGRRAQWRPAARRPTA